MSSMTTDALMPAYASLQVEVYLAAPAALDSHTAGRTAQFLCPEWTPQRHMDYGIAQHAIALGLQPGADQNACTAAAFMHCAAGGHALTPEKVPALNKAMHPRALRPIHSRKPAQIGTTRSGKKIFDVYAHPAHASFTAADHRDMIAAAAAAYKPKTPKI